MNKHRIVPSLLAALLVGAPFLFNPTKAQAQAETPGPKFICGQSAGVPATLAKTSRGNVPVILWRSTLGDGVYTPAVRCAKVTERFQEYFANGTLKFLTTGIMNKQPVVCVAQHQGGPCNGLLFTLKPGSNPGQTLKNLMAVQVGSRGPLNESAARVYINMDEFLTTAPVDANATLSVEPPETSQLPTPLNTLPQVNLSPTPTPTNGAVQVLW
jgi:hypothetical protein